MRILAEEFSGLLNLWAPPVAILIVTLLAAWTARRILGRLAAVKSLTFLQEMAPALASLIYLVGARMLIDASPLPPTIEHWISGAFYVGSVLVVLWLVRRAAMIGLEWSALRTNHSPTLHQGFIPLLRNLVTFFVFSMGGIMVLKHFDYDVLSLLTALGVGSLAIGLAAKETLSNMISGFTLIIDRNLRPGERVNLGGFVGDVEEIGLRSTRIRMGNGSTLIVPNADMVNNKIINLSQPSRSQACSATFRIPVDAPFEQVRRLCLESLADLPGVRRDKTGVVNLTSLADGAQHLTVGFWVEDLDSEAQAISEFNQRILLKLASHKIAILPPPSGPQRA